MVDRKTRVIAIATTKGGVLKTSVTTNLAGSLSRKGFKVLIVDVDSQGNCLSTFGMNPDLVHRNIYTVLIKGLDPKKAIISVPHTNIDIIGANDDMNEFVFEVLMKHEEYGHPYHLMEKALSGFVGDYDYVLVDTPPEHGLSQGNIFTFVDSVIIPFQPEVYAMRALIKTFEAITDFRSHHNPTLAVEGVLATLVNFRTNLHQDALEECKKFCHQHKIHMFKVVIPHSIKYANSVSYYKLPLTLDDKQAKIHPFAEHYHELANIITKDETRTGGIVHVEKKASWFSRYFRSGGNIEGGKELDS